MRLSSKDLQASQLIHVQMIFHTFILFPLHTTECNSQVYSHHEILHRVSGWSHTADADLHEVSSGYFSICKVTMCNNFILNNKFSMVVVFLISTRCGPSYVASRVPSMTACFSLMDTWHILISCLTVTLTRKVSIAIDLSIPLLLNSAMKIFRSSCCCQSFLSGNFLDTSLAEEMPLLLVFRNIRFYYFFFFMNIPKFWAMKAVV